MALIPGTRLGAYEIVALVGAGGMGEVDRARDTRLDRPVALKIVKPGWSDTEEGRRRFEREARVISKLNHPNVCAIYDVGLLPCVGRRRHPELACAPALTMGATGAAASQP